MKKNLNGVPGARYQVPAVLRETPASREQPQADSSPSTALRAGRKPAPLVGSALAVLSILAGVVFFLLSGCSALDALNIENPRYSIRDIRPRVDIAIPLSASSIDIDFNLEVDNPNSVGLRLDQIDFDLFINDTRVLDSISEQGVRIPARGIGDVHLRTRIGYQNIRSIWNEVVNIVRGERARYELRGNAYYDTPAGRLRFPVSVYSTR
jgi:LEA14-like dessication related protein